MDPRTFRFSSDFSLGVPAARVHDVLVDLEHYADWWPQVRAVAKVDDDHAWVVCRSTLPYDLDLLLTARDRSPRRLEVGLEGPIEGHARFELAEPSPGRTSVRFEQEVRAVAAPFVAAAYVVRPLLVWNHDRMMSGCVTGLRDLLGGPEPQPRAATAAS